MAESISIRASAMAARGRERFLFFYVFAAGLLSIVSMHWLGLPQLITTVLTVSLMFGYMAFELRSGRFKGLEDRLGDDLYYLGLLFTLVSLAMSLRIFGNQALSESDTIDELIGNFGIAIFTTIVGLALRVGLYKLRGDDLEEVELKSKIDIAQAAGRLKAQLMSAVEDTGTFRLALSQSLAELVMDTTKKVSLAIQEGLDEVRVQSVAAKSAAEQALGDLRGPLVKLNEAAERLSVELERLWQRVESVEVPPDLLQNELAPTLKIIARHARVVEKAIAVEQERSKQTGEALSHLGSIARQAQERLQQMVQSTEAIANLGSHLEIAGSEIGTLVATLINVKGQLANGAGELSEALGRLTSESVGMLQTAKVSREALDQEVAKSHDAVSKINGALVSMTSLIIDRLDNGGN